MTWREPEDPYLDTHRTRSNVTIEVDGHIAAHAALTGEDERGPFIANTNRPPITTEEKP